MHSCPNSNASMVGESPCPLPRHVPSSQAIGAQSGCRLSGSSKAMSGVVGLEELVQDDHGHVTGQHDDRSHQYDEKGFHGGRVYLRLIPNRSRASSHDIGVRCAIFPRCTTRSTSCALLSTGTPLARVRTSSMPTRR